MKLAFAFAGLAFIGAAAVAAPGMQDMQGMKSTQEMKTMKDMEPPMVMGHDHAQNASAAKVSSTLTVSGCWIRALPQPSPSAGYFVVHNSGSTPAKLKSATSQAYGMIMLHKTTTEGGMSKMSMTHDITIPAKGKLEFKPGGYHAMLEKAHGPIAVGSSVDMEFLFDSGEKAQAACEVKPANTLVH